MLLQQGVSSHTTQQISVFLDAPPSSLHWILEYAKASVESDMLYLHINLPLSPPTSLAWKAGTGVFCSLSELFWSCVDIAKVSNKKRPPGCGGLVFSQPAPIHTRCWWVGKGLVCMTGFEKGRLCFVWGALFLGLLYRPLGGQQYKASTWDFTGKTGIGLGGQ